MVETFLRLARLPVNASRVWSYLILLFLLGFSAWCQAKGTLTVNLKGKFIPKQALISVRVIDLANAALLGSKSYRNQKRISVNCQTDYCLAVISATSVSGQDNKRQMEFYGTSRAFGAKLPANRPQKVKIASRRMANQSALTEQMSAAAAGSSELRIAVPPDAFTVSGPGAKEIVPRGASAMTITPLVQAPCYDKPGKFHVVESDPRVLKAIEREFELVRQGFVDPANAPVNTAQPANAFVKGHVDANGGSFTVSMQLTGSDGAVIGSSSGSASNYFTAIDAAANALISQLCSDATLTISQSACVATDCRCCSKEEAACYGKEYTQRFGGSVSLPVNGEIRLNTSTSLGGTISCPGYTPEDCKPTVCCRRTSSDQPETGSWSGEQHFPPVCVCPAGAIPVSVNLVAIASDGKGKSEEKRVNGLVCSP